MDGEITFESEANKGSKFCVNLYLPISNMQDTPYAHAEPDREILASLQGISVLIVDDLEANTLVINNFLEKWGIITDIAFTGRDAIEKAKTNKYHLILMDLHMPDMDGQTTTFELRKIEEYEDVPIIAITASALVVNKSLTEKDGINDYITKPFKAEDLLAKIVKHLVPLAKP
jgi:CheY-like chemotaxis protein